MRKITTVRTAAATLALCAAAGLTTAATAAAAPASGFNDPGANRPALEVPFPCGDVWSGQTRGADDPHPHNPLLAIDFNLPIGCGGVPVFPGDIVVGDGEGVVVIPAGIADEIANEAHEMTAFEDFVTEQVMAGRSIIGLYPPTQEQTLTDFAAWREKTGR